MNGVDDFRKLSSSSGKTSYDSNGRDQFIESHGDLLLVRTNENTSSVEFSFWICREKDWKALNSKGFQSRYGVQNP